MKRAQLTIALAVASLGTFGVAQAQQQPRPAPTEDRVGFPEGYQTNFGPFYLFDRPDNRSVRPVFANEQAASAKPGEPFPYGSILVMETYRAVVDEEGKPALDPDGRFQRGELGGIFVMRKEPGFGAEYGPQRNGEWEYVAFRPDGSYASPPQATNSCATCHLDAGGTRDWVWRANLFFYGESGAVPQPPPGLEAAGRAVMQSYLFLPGSMTVRPGATVSWTNEDSALHTVVAGDGSFDSGRLPPGGRFSRTFDQPGTYPYSCVLHPSSMQATVVVEA